MVALFTSDPSTERAGLRLPFPADRAGRRLRRSGSLQVLQGSLSARRVERQSPLMAGLHRITTGVLTGLGVSVVGLSALSFHWQSVWAANYNHLQASRTLEQKLQESAALLEQHHLSAVRRPGQLVPPSRQRLLHLVPPRVNASSR
ncbi:MAG: hypothetical protein ACK512_04380, partial [Cyanobium sp.]